MYSYNISFTGDKLSKNLESKKMKKKINMFFSKAVSTSNNSDANTSKNLDVNTSEKEK